MTGWEKEHIAAQLRAGVPATEVMDGVRARRAEEASAVRLAESLLDPTMPWNHDFQPDPLTPSACVIEALGPAWHRNHQPAPDPDASSEPTA